MLVGLMDEAVKPPHEGAPAVNGVIAQMDARGFELPVHCPSTDTARS